MSSEPSNRADSDKGEGGEGVSRRQGDSGDGLEGDGETVVSFKFPDV